jgi:hypothetical protein
MKLSGLELLKVSGVLKEEGGRTSDLEDEHGSAGCGRGFGCGAAG